MKQVLGLIATGIVAATLSVRAELPGWLRHVEAGAVHDALFRTVATPAGPVEVRRAPADAREALTRLPGVAADRELLALRARLDEEQLDSEAAEVDWKAYASASTDAAAGQLALADFYHRRLLPQKEADALAAAAEGPEPPSDHLLRAPERRSWRAFERIFTLIDAQQLPDEFAETEYRAWIARYPREKPPYDRFLQFLIGHDRVVDADALARLGTGRPFPPTKPRC